MMKILGKRISDNRFKGLIGRLLEVAIQDATGQLEPTEIGTPQGSIASPILANIYLHEVLDKWFLENHASYNNIIVRYADDAVFFFKDKDVATSFLKQLNDRVSLFGLSLNEDKTGIIDFHNTENNQYDFLGFTFYWGQTVRFKRQLSVKTQKKKLHKKLQEFDQWVKEVRCKLKTSEIWDLAKAKLLGHYQHFGYWMNRPKLNHFYWEATKSLFKWLNRRSQKRSYSWEGFEERLEQFPLPKPPGPTQLRKLGWSPYA